MLLANLVLPAVAAGLFAPAQAPAKDYSVLLPVYSAPTSFVPGPGERLWLGSFVPTLEGISGLISSGVTMFVAETDELGPPDAGRGIYDLDFLAAQRRVINEAGVAWGVDIHTLFPTFDDSLIVGEGTVNVRDGERVPAWSPWNPERLRWAADRYGAVNRRFPNLPFVGIGIFGEYGDAGFFTGLARRDRTQREAWSERLRAEAPAAGFWSGDPLALQSWRSRLAAEYGSVEAAYRAWGLAADANAVPVPLDASFPISARLLYMDWYRSAMPELASRLADVAANIFKDTPVLVPVGPPTDSPHLGLDAYRLAGAVSGTAAGLKVTNVGYYDFASNWAMSLARIRAASRAANIPLFTEAPVAGTPRDFHERIFTALSLGARGHTDWPDTLSAHGAVLRDLWPYWTHSAPRCDVAVLHPTSSHLLNPNQVVPPATFRSLVELRDYADYDLLEESAVIGGALQGYRVAAVFEGTVWQPQTLTALRNWVNGGGTLLAYNFGRMADPQGNAAVYNELFSFVEDLEPAEPTDVWVGDIPAAYSLQLGTADDAEYLLGQWGQVGAEGGRPASGSATLRLPRPGETSLVVSVHFGDQATPVQRLDFLVDGDPVAGVGLEGGIRQFRFIVDRRILSGNTFNLTIGGLERGQSVLINSVVVSTPDAEGEPERLAGRFEAPVDIEDVKKWVQPFGQGRVIYFPARREQWKQFISVVRHAVYRLSQIAPGAVNARLLDDRRDGVYMTDLGRRVAVYNSNDEPATRTLPLARGASEVALPPGVSIISAEPQPFTAILEAEDSEEAQEMQLLEYELASPGEGVTAVRVEPGGELILRAAVPADGRYKVFARTLRNAALAPVEFTVNGIASRPGAAAAPTDRDVYFVGEFELQQGPVEIRMWADVPFIADLVVVTDKPNLSAFAFPRR